MPSDLRCLGLPTRREFVYKNHVVRISYRNRNPAHLAKCHLDGKHVTHLRLAHVHLEFELLASALQQMAALGSGAGSHHYGILIVLSSEVCGHTPRAIARNLRFRTVGIEESRSYVRILGRKKPLHAVRANTLVAVTNFLAEFFEAGRCVHSINDQKIISARCSFDKRDSSKFGSRTHYSPSAGPSELTVWKTADFLNSCRIVRSCAGVVSTTN